MKGGHNRRPDLVLYINGIAFGVIELKNSRVSIGDGIRQNLSNQKPEFNEWFFTTVQILFAGNDTEGLRYGTIQTPEKFYLTWKEDVQDNERLKLDKYLLKMCRKERIIELMHDFVLFDGGVKNDYGAYKEVKNGFKELVRQDEIEEVKKLGLQLMKDGSYQVACSDEGLMSYEIEDCLKTAIRGVKSKAPGESQDWAIEMRNADRVGFICEAALKKLAGM